MVFELIIGWLYRQLTGIKEPCRVPARITENVAAAGGKTTCLPVELSEEPEAAGITASGCIYSARPLFGKSGLMTTLARADGYTLIDTDDEGLKEDQIVQVTLF